MNKSTSILTRIFLILLSIIFLMGPGAFFLYVSWLAFNEEGVLAVIIPGVIGLIFIGGGIAGVVANVRNKN